MTRLLLLGHRGARASSQVPENTLASFELCLRHGCDGFELDVRASSDGTAVICHDPTVGGSSIAHVPRSKLPLDTLQEVLQQFGQRAFLDIELKVPGMEAGTLALLAANPPKRGFVISSFLPQVLATIHAIDSSIPLGIICESKAQMRGWENSPARWLIPHRQLLDESLVGNVHAAGKKIMVWTVNRAEPMRRFAAWGVDGLISDETRLMRRALRAAESSHT